MLILIEECDLMKYRFHKQVSMIMKDAAQEAKDMGNNYVGSEHVLLALLKDTTTSFSKLLAKQGIYYYQLKEDLMVLFGLQEKESGDIQMTQVVDDILERSAFLMNERGKRMIDVDMLSIALLQTQSCVANEILLRYDVELSSLLRELSGQELSELDNINELRNLNLCKNNRDIVGRDQELALMISILSRKEKANPLLIGEPGVGKTALVEKLAGMIADGQVQEGLKNSVIYELHLNSLVAGTKYRGDFEEKIQNLIKVLEKYPNVILFIDEIHQMIGAGKSEGSIDVSSVLKPYLARGVIKCIGATTLDEYEKYIEKDRALERRFQIIMVKEPDKATCEAMIESKLKEYELFHQVKIPKQVIHDMIEYCDYFMPQRKFPDKAIDVLDLSCVHAKAQEDKTVNDGIVRKVIEQLTDIPLESCDRLHKVRACLYERVIAQRPIIDRLMAQLSWIEQGVIQNRPLGVWLFCGEHCCGKKTLMKEFTRAYFNQEEMIELDVSMIDVSLHPVMNKIKRNPYTTVHVANLHCASPTTLSLLRCSILKGFMEVSDQRVDLRHSIFIMSGEFTLPAQDSLHFFETQTYQTMLEKQLGKEFMEIFDDIFLFESLKESDKLSVLRRETQNWRHAPDELTLINACRQSDTVEHALKQLRSGVMHTM